MPGVPELSAQGIRDSVFEIRELEVTHAGSFVRERAGMKETAIDSALLNAKINRSLSDILSENTQVYIKNYGRGALATASFRGTATNHTRVSWNGIPLNSPMLGMVDFSLIPVYMIDEMNLQHGAASLGFQSGGPGGHIELKSTADWSNRLSGSYYQSLGSFSSFDEFARFNAGSASFQSKTRLYHSWSKNDYTFTNKYLPGYPEMRNQDAAYRSMGAAQEFYMRIREKHVLSARVWYQDSRRSVPEVQSLDLRDTSVYRKNREDNRFLRAVVKLQSYHRKLNTGVQSGFDHQELDYLVRTGIRGQGEIFPVNSGSQINSWFNRLTSHYELSDLLSLKLNGNYNYYRISTLDTAILQGYDAGRHEVSLFGGAYMNLRERLLLSLQLRKDWLSDLHSPLNVSAGFTLRMLSGEQLLLKGGISRTVSNPGLNDLYWQPGGNPDLKSERALNVETGLETLIPLPFGTLDAEVTAYRMRVEDWILWLPGLKGYWEPFNLKEVLSTGTEIKLNLKARLGINRFRILANYAFTRSENRGEPLVEGDESGNKQLPFIPLHSANLLASAERRGWLLSFQHNFYSRRYLLTSNRAGLSDDSEILGLTGGDNPMLSLYPYFMNEISLGKKFSLERMSAGLEIQVHNLLNEEYRSVLQRFMPGRHYTLLLKLEF